MTSTGQSTARFPVRYEETGVPDPKPIIDLDIHVEEFTGDNYGYCEELRECPVAWSTEQGGHWLLTGYDASFDATRDDDTFISSLGTALKVMRPKGAENTGPVPIETDPPATAEYRKVAAVKLSPVAVPEREDEIRKNVNLLINASYENLSWTLELKSTQGLCRTHAMQCGV